MNGKIEPDKPTDEMCPHCGLYFSRRGIIPHQEHCDLQKYDDTILPADRHDDVDLFDDEEDDKEDTPANGSEGDASSNSEGTPPESEGVASSEGESPEGDTLEAEGNTPTATDGGDSGLGLDGRPEPETADVDDVEHDAGDDHQDDDQDGEPCPHCEEPIDNFDELDPGIYKCGNCAGRFKVSA